MIYVRKAEATKLREESKQYKHKIVQVVKKCGFYHFPTEAAVSYNYKKVRRDTMENKLPKLMARILNGDAEAHLSTRCDLSTEETLETQTN